MSGLIIYAIESKSKTSVIPSKRPIFLRRLIARLPCQLEYALFGQLE